jgi:hypothetical protein
METTPRHSQPVIDRPQIFPITTAIPVIVATTNHTTTTTAASPLTLPDITVTLAASATLVGTAIAGAATINHPPSTAIRTQDGNTVATNTTKKTTRESKITSVARE